MTAARAASPALLRAPGSERGRVGTVELFFDLVFVFAVTQLSHTLLAHMDAGGALRTGMLFLGMWWLWIYTSWVTNWLEPDHPATRLLLFALMLGGLILSSSIPQAFAERGLVFAAVFAAMQVGRSLFTAAAFRGAGQSRVRNFLRISAWLSVSGACWIAGGLADPGTRVAWWGAALAIEYAGPAAYFRVPGLGRSTTADWDIDPGHMAERCGLFVIIALGESLLVTGATFAELEWRGPTLAAFLVSFAGSVAMWWLYFDTGSVRAEHHFSRARDPARVARMAYTYLHLLIVAGIIVCAVADELVIAHPDHVSDAGIAAILGGPALYLLGNALFKWRTNQRPTPPLSHMAGLLALLALAPFAFAHLFPSLALGSLTTAVLAGVAAWETLALRRPAHARNAAT